MATNHSDSKPTLYGYFRSSCSGRIRIALRYKNIDFDYIPVNLKDGLHLKEDYKKVNSSLSVPTLFSPGNPGPIIQSQSQLDYLEEAYPDAPKLMPKDAFSRARVRDLINIITNDVQPPTNMRVMKKVGALGYDGAKWSREYHALGFDSFEAILRDTAGKYCFGDEITLADVCLAPAVWNAERWELDMSPYPLITKVYKNAATHPAFKEGHWKRQIDCPESLRGENEEKGNMDDIVGPR